MEEMKQDAQVRIKTPVLERIENFWYHYKWHTLITLFIVLVVTICTVQMCGKESYDVYVLYGGDLEVVRTSSDGTEPPYNKMKDILEAYAVDRDGDGKVEVAYQTLYLLTNQEIERINEERRQQAEQNGQTRYEEVNVNYIKENLTIFQSDIRYGDYYICILSRDMYELYRTTNDGVALFAPLSPYVNDGGVKYLADDAIYLSSTTLGKTAPFADMPEDTVICLRQLSEFSARKARNREMHAASEDVLRRMLSPTP